MRRWLIAIFACGCGRAPPPAEPAAQPLFTIRPSSVGPITAATPATLVALRAALAGLEVEPVNDGGLEYRVSRAGTHLFDVIPDARGRVESVHVVTPDIDVAGRAWRVNARFVDPERIDTCECWADQTVCFKEGEHVAIGLAKICREGGLASAAARDALAGTPIRTTIWSPRALAAGGHAAPAPADAPDPEPADEPDVP